MDVQVKEAVSSSSWSPSVAPATRCEYGGTYIFLANSIEHPPCKQESQLMLLPTETRCLDQGPTRGSHRP